MQEKKLDSEVLKAVDDVHFIAWTTTPWTLPSNMALVLDQNRLRFGKDLQPIFRKAYEYCFGQALVSKQLSGKYAEAENEHEFKAYEFGAKKIPYIIDEVKGADMVEHDMSSSAICPTLSGCRPFSGYFGRFCNDRRWYWYCSLCTYFWCR